MPRNTSVSLSDHFVAFIEAKVREGRYGSASEVIRAGLRLLEEEEDRYAELRAAIEEGERSGFIEDFDFETLRRELRDEASH